MRSLDIGGFERLAVNRLNVTGDVDVRTDVGAAGTEVVIRKEAAGLITVGGELTGLSGESAAEMTSEWIVVSSDAMPIFVIWRGTFCPPRGAFFRSNRVCSGAFPVFHRVFLRHRRRRTGQ